MTSFYILKSGEVLTTLTNWVPKLNTLAGRLRDLVTPLSWGSFKSTVTASGSLSIAVTASTFWYFRLFKTVFIVVYIKGTLSGTASNEIRFTLEDEVYTDAGLDVFHAAIEASGVSISGHGLVSTDKTTVAVKKYSSNNYTASGDIILKVAGFYRIR